MNKYFLIIVLSLLFSGKFIAQVTLTSNITPRPGDIQYRVRVDTNGINPGNPGPNQNWTFGNFARLDSIATIWVSAASTPYFSYFPSSKIATFDTCYGYFDTSTAKIEYAGQYTQGTPIQYSNLQTILSYPFGYNSVLNDNFEAAFSDNGDVIHRTGTVNVTADAWGTIHLPSGTYSNALRLKHVITTRDSSTAMQFVFLTTYTIYEWYVPGKKFNVFNIVYIEINFLNDNTSFSFKNCTYNPSSVPIGIAPISSFVPSEFSLKQNYPNPFNPATKIRFDIPASNERIEGVLSVYDILGRTVAELVNQPLQPGSYEVDFNATPLSSGTYFYRLQAGKFTSVKKMILIK